MNIPSYYQNDLFNELCKRYEKFEVIYAHEEDFARKKQGWSFDLIQSYDAKTISKYLEISQLKSEINTHRKWHLGRTIFFLRTCAFESFWE
jgi:hypothetical protein